MTYAPFTLSDTAMVLLREYIEAETASRLLAQNREYSTGIDRHKTLMVFGALHDYQRSLEKALLDDIWCLLNLQDLPLIRHLDWHITLDGALLKEAERVVTPPWMPNPEMTPPLPAGHTSMYVSLLPMMRASFLDFLAEAYHEALAVYHNTASEATHDSRPSDTE